MEFLTSIYENLLLLKPKKEMFSIQTVYAAMFVLAFILSIYKASKNRELFTNFITIACICFNYLLSAWLVQLIYNYAENNENIALTQHTYLAVIVLNFATWYLAYRMHLKQAFVFGELYIAVRRLLLILSLCHFLIWIKLVALKIQVEYAELNYAYTVMVNYISLSLGFIMMFPSILKTKVRKVATLSFS